MPQFLDYEFYGNTVLKYILFAVAVIVSFVIIRIVGYFILKHSARLAKKTKTTADDVLVKSLKKYMIPAAYFVAFYLSTKILVLGPALSEVVKVIVTAAIIIFAAIFISTFAVFIFNRYWETARKTESNVKAVKIISGLIKIVVWGIAVIQFLDSIGQPVSTLVAGLGISGIAIAFAAQAILGDVFCYFTIFFDRPFEIGDFIVAGEQMGTVEYIGLKTTRLRALSGEQLIFSNTDLTNARIQNYKTMEQRRVLFTLGVTYDTPHEKLREIPGIIKGIIESVGDTQFGRSHFSSFGDSSLNYETAYYILSNDYDKFMDIHQEVNLRIKETFDNSGIEFAFPTQTIHIASQLQPGPGINQA